MVGWCRVYLATRAESGKSCVTRRGLLASTLSAVRSRWRLGLIRTVSRCIDKGSTCVWPQKSFCGYRADHLGSTEVTLSARHKANMYAQAEREAVFHSTSVRYLSIRPGTRIYKVQSLHDASASKPMMRSGARVLNVQSMCNAQTGDSSVLPGTRGSNVQSLHGASVSDLSIQSGAGSCYVQVPHCISVRAQLYS